jgi:predicted nuclease of predicted toxin-antitoxin system
MRFLADMNVSPSTVEALRDQGWDVLRVSEVLPPDTIDLDILEWARAQGRIVIPLHYDPPVIRVENRSQWNTPYRRSGRHDTLVGSA